MNPAPPATVDLTKYFARIGYQGELLPSLAVLRQLHLAHATHIPFENLDVLLGRPIRLDLPSLQAKMVRNRRGGYCFEHNLLFAAVLEQIGFTVTRLAARVRWGTTRLLPRTHMFMTLEVDGMRCLADVGFGGWGLLQPLPLVPGPEARQFAWTYRLLEENGGWLLQAKRLGEWVELYAFTLEPHYLVDFEMANFYVSTHPESRFVQTLGVQKPGPETRFILRNREFTVASADRESTRTLADDAEVLAVLAESFDLHFPSGTRFRIQ